MSSATLKKIIPCKKDQLVEMVLDIEKYPEFVPWCLGGKIHEKKEAPPSEIFFVSHLRKISTNETQHNIRSIHPKIIPNLTFDSFV